MEIFYKCNSCDGTGSKLEEYGYKLRKCYKCNGTGRLNWIENIFGTMEKEIQFDNNSDLNDTSSWLKGFFVREK